MTLLAVILFFVFFFLVCTFCFQNPDADVSVILCGDFNSTPECGIFQLMTTGNAPENLVDWKSSKPHYL